MATKDRFNGMFKFRADRKAVLFGPVRTVQKERWMSGAEVFLTASETSVCPEAATSPTDDPGIVLSSVRAAEEKNAH
ncbi:hypothetical protein NQZ68_035875 [Dissostichus eleginoides]|nr:hypothetical protein NQZ68_035875 [Dissostichus eleginoides]